MILRVNNMRNKKQIGAENSKFNLFRFRGISPRYGDWQLPTNAIYSGKLLNT